MAAPKSVVGQFVVHMGPATVTGSLHSIKAPEPKSTIVTCGPNGEIVKQGYSDGENFWTQKECGKGEKQEDGSMKLLSAEAVALAKASPLPKNILNVEIHRAEEVDKFLFRSPDSSYVMFPVIKNGRKVIEDPANDKWYEFIRTAVAESPEHTFVGRANIRNKESTVRLGIHEGHLMIERMLYPEQLNEFPEPSGGLTATEKAKAKAIVQALATPFDLGAHKDSVPERLAVAVEAGAEAPVVIEPEPIPDTFDLESALDSFTA